MQKLFGLFRKDQNYHSKLKGYVAAFLGQGKAELLTELARLNEEKKFLELQIGEAKFKKISPADNNPNTQSNNMISLMIAEARIAATRILLATRHEYLLNAESADFLYSQLDQKLLGYEEQLRSNKIEATADFKAELACLQNAFLDELRMLVNPTTEFTSLNCVDTSDELVNSNSTSVKKVKQEKQAEKMTPMLQGAPSVIPKKNAEKASTVNKGSSEKSVTNATNPNGVFNETAKQLENRGSILSKVLEDAQTLEKASKKSVDSSKRVQSGIKKI